MEEIYVYVEVCNTHKRYRQSKGVETALSYLASKGMQGSTYSANSLLHGLYSRAAGFDFGQTALELMTQCTEHSVGSFVFICLNENPFLD